MGVYDMFYLEIECPKCGNKFEDCAQTKSLYCEMKEYHIGDSVYVERQKTKQSIFEHFISLIYEVLNNHFSRFANKLKFLERWMQKTDKLYWPDDNIFVYSWCNKCKSEVYQGIRIEDGVVKEKTEAFVKGELPGRLDEWFGKLYFPSDVAEYLKTYRYEQHVVKEEK